MAKFGKAAAEQDKERIDALGDAIREAAQMKHLRPALVAAIVSRETRGLPAYFIGDNGHGCGPMQVDDRTDPVLCARYKAGDVSNQVMIMSGCKILRDKFEILRKNTHLNDAKSIERASIAAYNCGQGNVCKALAAGADVDRFTTDQNYSWDVLQRAAWFEENGYG